MVFIAFMAHIYYVEDKMNYKKYMFKRDRDCYIGACGKYEECYECYGWKHDIRQFIAYFTTLKIWRVK
jgi:hypothetical protein